MAFKSVTQVMPVVQAPVLSSTLIFNHVQLHIIDRAGQPWIRSPQIAEALGYGQANRINDLYARHADEFTSAMTAVVTLPTDGGPQETRIFSLRGCHLLAMFARTPVAKQFRRWVLDVLEEWESGKSQSTAPSHSAPTTGKTYTLPAEPYLRLNTAQMQALRSAHKAWAEEVTYNDRFKGGHATWLILKGHFGGVTRLDDLPADWFLDLIEFCHEQQEKELARRRARREMPKPRLAPALPPVPPTPQPNYDVPWGDIPQKVSDAARQAAQVALPLNNARHTAVALACLIEQARETLDALRALSALEVK